MTSLICSTAPLRASSPSALGGLAGGIGSDLIGPPLVFLAPAAFALLATVGLAVVSASRHAIR